MENLFQCNISFGNEENPDRWVFAGEVNSEALMDVKGGMVFGQQAALDGELRL